MDEFQNLDYCDKLGLILIPNYFEFISNTPKIEVINNQVIIEFTNGS